MVLGSSAPRGRSSGGGVSIGTVVRVDADGPYVELPRHARGYEIGPCLSAVGDLAVGDSVVVMPLAHDSDSYVIIGRNGGGPGTPGEHTHDDRYYTEAETADLVAAKVSKAGDTMTGALTLPSAVITPTVGTAKARFGGLPGIEAWTGMFLNCSFNGAGWVLDDVTKPGWFFKLDSRAVATEFAVYKVPAGAGVHTDESFVMRVGLNGLVTVVNRITGVANATGASDALPKGQADALYAATAHTHDDRYYTEAEVDAKIAAAGAGVPIGTELTWAGPVSTIPVGWYLANGLELPIADYPTAYARLTNGGTVFPHGANTNGAGAAGSTHFRLPNRKGRTVVGLDPADASFDVVGETGGAKTVTLTTAQIPGHTHSGTTGDDTPDHSHRQQIVNTSGHDNNYQYPSVGSAANGGFSTGAANTQGASVRHRHPFTTDAGTGGNGAHENMPPYVVVPIIVKIHDASPEALDTGPGVIEVGDVKWTASATASSKWKPADGTVLKRADWPQAFAAMGTTHNTGTEAGDEFRLPDLRDRVALGASATRARGTRGGAETHTLTVAEMPSHNHGGATDIGWTAFLRHVYASGNQSVGYNNHVAGAGNAAYTDVSNSTGFNGGNHTHGIGSQGGGTAHNNMQPYVALTPFVRMVP